MTAAEQALTINETPGSQVAVPDAGPCPAINTSPVSQEPVSIAEDYSETERTLEAWSSAVHGQFPATWVNLPVPPSVPSNAASSALWQSPVGPSPTFSEDSTSTEAPLNFWENAAAANLSSTLYPNGVTGDLQLAGPTSILWSAPGANYTSCVNPNSVLWSAPGAEGTDQQVSFSYPTVTEYDQISVPYPSETGVKEAPTPFLPPMFDDPGSFSSFSFSPAVGVSQPSLSFPPETGFNQPTLSYPSVTEVHAMSYCLPSMAEIEQTPFSVSSVAEVRQTPISRGSGPVMDSLESLGARHVSNNSPYPEPWPAASWPASASFPASNTTGLPPASVSGQAAESLKALSEEQAPSSQSSVTVTDGSEVLSPVNHSLTNATEIPAIEQFDLTNIAEFQATDLDMGQFPLPNEIAELIAVGQAQFMIDQAAGSLAMAQFPLTDNVAEISATAHPHYTINQATRSSALRQPPLTNNDAELSATAHPQSTINQATASPAMEQYYLGDDVDGSTTEELFPLGEAAESLFASAPSPPIINAADAEEDPLFRLNPSDATIERATDTTRPYEGEEEEEGEGERDSKRVRLTM